jgi:arabinofuranosyltransferase
MSSPIPDAAAAPPSPALTRFDPWLSAGAAACVVVHVVTAWPTFPSLVDDAWISARYARHIAAGDGPVYNTGEWIEGYTNLLWTLMLAVGERGHLPMATLMAGLGLAHSVALVLGVIALARQLGAGRYALAPGLWIATDPHAAVVATNGIESSQFAAATVWSAACFVGGWRAPATVLAMLLPAIRPEGAAVSAAISVGFGWRHRSAAPAIGSLLGLAAVFGSRWYWFADIVPNTWRAKSHKGIADQLQFNLKYLSPDGPWWVIVALLLVAAAWRARRDPVRAWLIALTLGLVATAFSVDMWMPGGRLLLPAVSLTLALFGSQLAEILPRRPRVAIGAAMFAVVPMVVGPLPDWVRAYDLRHSAQPENIASEVGNYLGERIPAGAVLVTRDAGVLAYHWGNDHRMAEVHPRALTQRHHGAANADPKEYAPANPEVFVATVADPKWTRWYYPEDLQQFARRTVPYRYLGRIEQHYRRYYDVCVRADLAVPDLPAAWVTNQNGKRLCEAKPPTPED